jgi:hypothetical protein
VIAENDGISLMGRIAKLRRDMPRNGDVLAVCAALKKLLATVKPVEPTPQERPFRVDTTLPGFSATAAGRTRQARQHKPHRGNVDFLENAQNHVRDRSRAILAPRLPLR